MTLVDANLLIYARVTDVPDHPAAHRWLEERLNGTPRVGLPWPSLLAFVRITTNPRVFRNPMALMEAWRQVEQWLALPSVWVPQPTERHATVLSSQLAYIGGRSTLVSDAHLAALAIEHGLTLCSADGDFARFPALRWENPLQA